MTCPLCEGRNIRTIKTQRYEEFVVRERNCKDCGCIFDTSENTTHVHVLNPRTRKAEHIRIQIFQKDGWADVLLQKKTHPSQLTIYEKQT